MSLSGLGNELAVGGYGDSNYIGAVWVFYQDKGSFKQYLKKLVGNNAGGQSFQGKERRRPHIAKRQCAAKQSCFVSCVRCNFEVLTTDDFFPFSDFFSTQAILFPSHGPGST